MQQLKEYLEKNNPRAWLHFIGKQYYSPGKFIKEAEKYSVTRRIAPRTLKQMHWGDIILLAFSAGLKRSGKIFGWFILDNLHGVDLHKKCDGLEIDWHFEEGTEATKVERECGKYFVSGYGTVKGVLDLPEIAEHIEKEDMPMIGGRLQLFNKPILVKKLTYFMGFRGFEIINFMIDAEYKGYGEGQYYEQFKPLAGFKVILGENKIVNLQAYIKAK